jgi:ribosome-binding ATPase
MKIGISGFPRAGKTTVFNALTGLHAAVGGYGDPNKPNLGTIKVPDARIDRLSAIFSPRKTTYAEVVFVDFPGGGDRDGAVLDQATLVQMRDADALVQVVRGFADPVTQAAADPGRDIEAFKSELVLADLAIVEKRRERLRKEKGKEQEGELLARCQTALEAETPLRRIELAAADERTLAGFGLLSRLPLLVVVNVAESAAASRQSIRGEPCPVPNRSSGTSVPRRARGTPRCCVLSSPTRSSTTTSRWNRPRA